MHRDVLGKTLAILERHAGQRLRAATAHLLLDDGAPADLLKVEGSWWAFDANGRTFECRR